MKKYLVGGAVRDFLLKLPIKEKDWVVTGSSPQEMLDIGYEQVGKDFPVFLHPKNHEEYALARTESKSGPGYTGFICHTEPSVTIEEDLYRRDLTINAMAYDMHGNLLDPYNGQRDIKLRLLRHVSDAFHEDPLRVLRVARFAARFKNIGFTIAPETLKLMTHMTHELHTISIERIWMETKKALATDNPQIYFQVLHQCGSLKILFPELDILFSVSNFKKQNPINSTLGDYTMQKLHHIACLNSNLLTRFSVLCSDLGEIINLPIQLTNHFNLDVSNSSIINNFCNRLKIPHNFHKLATITSIYNNYLYDMTILSPKKIITIFDAFNCWRQPKNIDQIVSINQANLLTNLNNLDYLNTQEKFLRTAFKVTMQVKVNDIIQDGFTGSNISTELYNRRLYTLNMWNKINKLSTKT